MPTVSLVIVTFVALVVAGLQFVNMPMLDVVSEQTAYSVVQDTNGLQAAAKVESATSTKIIDPRPVTGHVPQPDQVKAIYMSACVAGTPWFRQELVDFINETEINSVVIDIKDASGSISFPPQGTLWLPAWQAAECGARDMREFIASLHAQDIYVIGRLQVFQDPLYAKQYPGRAVQTADGSAVWKDYKGISFVDVAARPYWDKIIELAAESYNVGFDEINYDYIRYPSDGNMKDTSYPMSALGEYGLDKSANLEAFFAYLAQEMRNPIHFDDYNHHNHGRATATPYFTGDLFGMTTSNYDDLSIGQVQERALPYFDAIAPMVYPSHYPNNYIGLGNPNDVPYAIVYHAMKTGVDRALATTSPINAFSHTRIGTSTPAQYTKEALGPDRFRTWIQDFDYGGDYDAADVRAQIQASYDAGVMDWMVWAPSNRYTRGAYMDVISATTSTSTPVSETAF